MKTHTKPLSQITLNKNKSLLNRIISSGLFSLVIVFLIHKVVYSAGIDAELNFLKQWIIITTIIFFWKKFLS